MNQHAASIPPEGRHCYAVRVYYEDTDAGGIVYHASYLRYAERARTEALRDLGIPHAEMVRRYNLMFVVRRIEVDYLRPARVDGSLVVETEILVAGAASATLRQTVRGAAGTCAVLAVKLACVRLLPGPPGTGPGGMGPQGTGPEGLGPERLGPGGSRPARLPQRWRTVLQAMRDARPAGTATGAASDGTGQGGCGGSSS
ncbi:MAG TPA: YbgC/FadM family acyl-CoA thioesterase [Acetobacteraceae bacterium]|nr:YbgC/FadM family acyl-CoA thioesterase [Acetobacteraceae bacterium]